MVPTITTSHVSSLEICSSTIYKDCNGSNTVLDITVDDGVVVVETDFGLGYKDRYSYTSLAPVKYHIDFFGKMVEQGVLEVVKKKGIRTLHVNDRCIQ